MNDWLMQSALWADASRFRSSNSSSLFRERKAQIEADDIWTGIMVIAGVVVAGFIVSRLLAWRRRANRNSPRRLFVELCKLHGLDRQSRNLLGQLAQAQRLKQPAMLFLDPDRFSSERLTPTLKPHAAELLKLRDRLFGQIVATPANASRPVRSESIESPSFASQAPVGLSN